MVNKKQLIYKDDARKAVLKASPSSVWCIDNIKSVDAVEVVRCEDCQHWHEETGWCNHHSHFIGADGEACHPWESANWKMFEPDDFCSYGEKRGVI